MCMFSPNILVQVSITTDETTILYKIAINSY